MSESTLRVIQKLLSRAEATEFDSERDSCLAKVAELMARYSIEEAVVAAARSAPGERDAPVERLLVVPSPYAARKVSLFGAVGAANSCRVIDLGSDEEGVRRVALIGFAGDVERSEALITSLLVQLTRSMLDPRTRDRDRPGRGSPGATAAWRRSFISGFTWRIQERLEVARRSERRRRAADDGGDGRPSLALVLAERDREVDAEVRRRYPYLRSRRMDGGSSAHGHRAGLQAGATADLGAPRVKGRRSLPA